MSEQVQGKRAFFQDYRKPCFYMVTMTTLGRKPLLGVCRENRIALSIEGKIAAELWEALPSTYPQMEMQASVFMPDHLHGIIHVKERMEKPLGVAIRAFKSQVTSALRKRSGNTALRIWTPDFHDAIVIRRGALAAYAHYVRDNPRRYCMRKAHPDLFVRVNNIEHSRLPQNEHWHGYGNLFFLDKPELMAVRVSRKATGQEIEAIKERVREAINEGVVIVSPFISPGEKAVAQMVLDAKEGNLILMKPGGFGKFYKPSGAYFDLCAEGRLLILSAFASEVGKVELTRDMCISMNGWCETLASNPPA